MRDAQHQLSARRWLCQLWFLWCLLAICVVPRAALGFNADDSMRISGATASFHDTTDRHQSPHDCSATARLRDVTHLPHARGTSLACEHAFAGEVAPPQAISSTIDVVSRLLTSPRMARVGAALHLGMPKDLVASDGAIAWSATHSAYGRVIATYADDTARARHGTAINSPFRLLGQVADDDAELCFTRYRCFDPEIGSWISSDPLEIAGGLNLYGFDGAPTDVVDPLGLATGGGDPHAKTLAEWLKDEPELLQELRDKHKATPEWQGIDPDKTPVFLRSKDDVDVIRAKPGESGGHHPHGLALGGPEGQVLTPTNETRKVKNPNHSAATGLQKRVINAITRQQ